MKTLRRVWGVLPLEACIWTGGLIVLAMLNPHEGHISICFFRAAGLPWCPGCGLGRSIAYLLHGDVAASWQTHPLGGVAVAVLCTRILVLTRHFIRSLTVTNPSLGKEHPCPTSSR